MFVKILLLSIVYQSATIVRGQPLDSRQLFANRFQNNHQYRLQDVIYFPGLTYQSHETLTESNSVAKNTLRTNSMKTRNHHTSPTLQKNVEVTTTAPKIDCKTLTDKECADYQKFINNLFIKTYNYKDNQDSNKDNLVDEKYDKLVQRNHFKSVSDNVIIPCDCDEETPVDDYDSTTTDDELSFRLPPPIVAALLG